MRLCVWILHKIEGSDIKICVCAWIKQVVYSIKDSYYFLYIILKCEISETVTSNAILLFMLFYIHELDESIWIRCGVVALVFHLLIIKIVSNFN
jgi:hypothetical protein